ncbi:MAG: hypothetical protein AUJ01_13855 [Acidobacteria bacterium 13_1_40CM_3_65_5]|nr:MAG: hypothetical protein AUJ01_13855 [Acidobacteria bacterium 13_1_40CM_3_65_5]
MDTIAMWRPPASIGVAPVVRLRMSSFVPTAASSSPLTAIASAHGAAGSPVHTRAFTIARLIGLPRTLLAPTQFLSAQPSDGRENIDRFNNNARHHQRETIGVTTELARKAG